MSIRIRRFDPGDVPAIDRLNARLGEHAITDRVWPESATTPSETRGDAMSQELYVAVDDGEVRGGYWLHEHRFFRRGEPFRAGWLKYPVSESLISAEYRGVPGAMLMTAMRRQPELMALGMGARDTPFAKLLASIGWNIIDIPLFVALTRPARVVRYFPKLRRSPVLQTAARVVSWTGLPNLAAAPLSLVRRRTLKQLLHGVAGTVVTEFGPWADEVWHDSHGHYSFIARRDAAMLNAFYKPNYPRLTRLRVQRDGKDIGWVCSTLADPSSQFAFREFGDLRVGFLADGLARPEDVPTIMAAGVRQLISQGADVVVTNQIHKSWCDPLKRFGFIPRATNFFFAYSRKIDARLSAEIAARDLYLNRGDCDGPPQWW